MNQPVIFLRESLRMQQQQRDEANRRLKDKDEPYPGPLRKVVSSLDSSITELIEAIAILEREYQVNEPEVIVPAFLYALDTYAGDGTTLVSVQYEDCPGEWTEPAELTRFQADKIKANKAVERIRLVLKSKMNREVEFIPA